MAKLEAMLEKRGIASPREMSEALARCQLHGGDLTTSLLQFVSVDEARLSAALSECYGLPAAVVGALPPPDEPTLRAVPSELAERYGCFPLESAAGRLVLAVARPLEVELKEELGFALGADIQERVALEVRVRQAISRHYGLPLSPRNQRGIARLEGDPDADPQEAPAGLWPETQLSALPRPPSERPSPVRESMRPGASSRPPSSGTRTHRRRGSLGLSQARDELSRSLSRQDVLDVFFGFACQFFEYSALFAVHSSLAEGLDAWGPGADREAVQGIGVPLDLPSSLSEAAESCRIRLVRLSEDGIDRTLATDLRRGSSARVLLLPICLRGRCAVLLYADNGASDVLEHELTDLAALAPDVAQALARIILQRKKANSQAPIDAAELSASLAPPAAATPRPNPEGEKGEARPSSVSSGHALGVAEAQGALKGIPNKMRDKSRSNARAGSNPNASSEPLRDTRPASLPSQELLGVEPAAAASSTAPELAGQSVPPAGTEDERAGDDPVFLLDRPSTKRAKTPPPSQPAPSGVPRPPIAITRPARTSASKPRLPSVIVDPSAVEAASPRRATATRAAAITRAPSLPRLPAMERRAAVPAPAAAPRAPSAPPAPKTLPATAAASSASAEPGLEQPLRGSAPIVVGPAPQSSPPARPRARPPARRAASGDTLAPLARGSRQEAARQDTARQDTARQDTARQDTARQDTARQDTARARSRPPQWVSTLPAPSAPREALPETAPAPPAAGPAPAPASVLLPPPPEDEMERLIELLCQGSGSAVQEIARIGPPTLPLLMARFPGPVITERAGPSSRASQCGPLLQALAAIGPAATPDITRSSEARDARVRRWATLLLGELPGPEACRAVVLRLADEVPRVHQAALDAARLLLASPAANLFRKTLFEVAEAEDAALTLRLRTLEHVAKLRDSASVPRLIGCLSTDTEPIVHKALWALTVVTRQDFGRDAQSWWDWWQLHQSRHRLEWLIEALDHRDPRLRRAAAEELQQETQDSFGYTEGLAQPERRVVRDRYRQWWATVGAPRFGR